MAEVVIHERLLGKVVEIASKLNGVEKGYIVGVIFDSSKTEREILFLVDKCESRQFSLWDARRCKRVPDNAG